MFRTIFVMTNRGFFGCCSSLSSNSWVVISGVANETTLRSGSVRDRMVAASGCSGVVSSVEEEACCCSWRAFLRGGAVMFTKEREEEGKNLGTRNLRVYVYQQGTGCMIYGR